MHRGLIRLFQVLGLVPYDSSSLSVSPRLQIWVSVLFSLHVAMGSWRIFLVFEFLFLEFESFSYELVTMMDPFVDFCRIICTALPSLAPHFRQKHVQLVKILGNKCSKRDVAWAVKAMSPMLLMLSVIKVLQIDREQGHEPPLGNLLDLVFSLTQQAFTTFHQVYLVLIWKSIELRLREQLRRLQKTRSKRRIREEREEYEETLTCITLFHRAFFPLIVVNFALQFVWMVLLYKSFALFVRNHTGSQELKGLIINIGMLQGVPVLFWQCFTGSRIQKEVSQVQSAFENLKGRYPGSSTTPAFDTTQHTSLMLQMYNQKDVDVLLNNATLFKLLQVSATYIVTVQQFTDLVEGT